MTEELNWLSATELSAGYRARRLSAVAVTEAALARCQAVQRRLNCFLTLLEERALASARAADEAAAAGRFLGPLHGIPVAIKDGTALAGTRTTEGSLVFRDRVTQHTAAVARRLEAAGAILIGKTALPEFAYASFTDGKLFGITRNPWNPEHTTGGSSGGAGAAVASGCVSLAEGTDMGGSVRIPAAWCGLVGIKPSLGRIPMDILPSGYDSISHHGPLARSVADAALFLRTVQGPDDADPQSLPGPAALYDDLEAPVAGLSVVVSYDLGYYHVEPEVKAALAQSVAWLREAGVTVEEVELGWTREASDRWYDLWRVYMAAYYGHLLPEHRDEMMPLVIKLIEAGQRISAVDYKRIEILRTRLWRDLAGLFQRHHALLTPTVAMPAPLVTQTDGEFGHDDAEGRYTGCELTHPFNLVPHCPAVTVPCGLSSGGLPLAAQFVGRRFDEPTVLRLARAIEKRLPLLDRMKGLAVT